MRVVVDTNELLRMAAGGDRSQLAQHWAIATLTC